MVCECPRFGGGGSAYCQDCSLGQCRYKVTLSRRNLQNKIVYFLLLFIHSAPKVSNPFSINSS